VNAGPKRKEIMMRATIDLLIDWLGKTDIPTVPLDEAKPFDCSRTAKRQPRETKRQEYKATTDASSCCDGGSCC